MSKKTKILLKLTLLILFTFLSLFLVFRKDYKDVLAILKTASFPFILIAIGCMLLVFFIDGCILTILVNLFQKGYKLHQGILNQQYNVFFNGITPLATGGQPFQVSYSRKTGMYLPLSRRAVSCLSARCSFGMHNFRPKSTSEAESCLPPCRKCKSR